MWGMLRVKGARKNRKEKEKRKKKREKKERLIAGLNPGI